jgi:hypothetical protein
MVRDWSFEDGQPRALGPDDLPDWFGEEQGRALIIQGDDAWDGTQFARLTCCGPQVFLFERFTALPYTNYTFTFHHRGGATSAFGGSLRIRYTGPWHNPITDPDGPGEECHDCYSQCDGCPPDFEEDLDINKIHLCDADFDGSTAEWQEASVKCTTGPETELAVVFYAEFLDGYIELDGMSVTEDIQDE